MITSIAVVFGNQQTVDPIKSDTNDPQPSIRETGKTDIMPDQVAAAEFAGYWQNLDVDTGGIIAVEITVVDSTLDIHIWGSCTPVWCDWGIEQVTFQENPVIVTFSFDYKVSTNYLTILPDGRLQLTSDNVFTDGTDRDYLATWFLHRFSANDYEGHWTNVDQNTGGLTTIDIMAADDRFVDIHSWGACVPTDCNWGVESSLFMMNPITVVYEFGFKNATNSHYLLEDGTMRVISVNEFFDGSNRNYTATYYFERSPVYDPAAVDFSGHWINDDPNTSWITAMDISTDGHLINVDAFGQCTPDDCVWETATAEFVGNPIKVLLWQGTTLRTFILTLHPDGTLHLDFRSDYDDGKVLKDSATYTRTYRQEFVGDWVRTDGSTLPYIYVSPVNSLDINVTIWDTCGGDPCYLGQSIDPADGNPHKISFYVGDVAPKTITSLLTLYDNGTLRLDQTWVYDDGRDDIIVVAYYEKAWQPLVTDWEGTWVHDGYTPFISRMDIMTSNGQIDVHTFGQCSPMYCNWDVNSTSFGNPITIVHNTITISYHTLTLFQNGTLKAVVDRNAKIYTHYYTKVSTQPVTTNDFDGYWVNVDSDTDGITAVEIRTNGADLDVGTWGRCHPRDCDWGVISTPFVGNPTVAEYHFSFKNAKNKMAIMPDGLLKVTSVNIFTDGSGRDYTQTWYFRKSDITDFVGYWANVDENTRGITVVDITQDGNQLDVQSFGACTPSDCDWGVIDTRFTGNPITTPYVFSFKQATNQMSILPDGRMMMFSENIFTDGTDRDYIGVWFFTKTGAGSDLQADFEGYWINVDNTTRSLTAMEITSSGTDLAVRTWGACTPIDCDWGEITQAYTGNPMHVHYSFSFKETDNTITLLSDGRLKVESFNTFTDDSGRGDYTSVDYFVKAPASDFIGYWQNEDDEARGIFGMEITPWGNDLLVESWGVCTPEPCPWGSAAGYYLSDPLEVTYYFSFKIADQVLTLLTATRLQLDSSNTFTDDSGRSDYSLTEYFVKGVKPSFLEDDVLGANTTITEGGTCDDCPSTETVTVTSPLPFVTLPLTLLTISLLVIVVYRRRKR